MAWLFDVWTLMFWLPVIASSATGWYAVQSGIVGRPMAPVLWFLSALLLQVTSAPLSTTWTIGMAAQTALAIALLIRVKLEA